MNAPSNHVIIHTDGACKGNPGPGGWGAILQAAGKTKEMSGGEPLIGFVHAPVGNADYEAVRGRGATRNGEPIRVDARQHLTGARITGPKPMLDRLTRGAGTEPDFEVIARIPSLALRLARVADGTVDIGMISGNARDWDLAAADLVLREAGGVVCDFGGAATLYNRPDPVHGELLAAPVGLRDPVLSAWDV